MAEELFKGKEDYEMRMKGGYAFDEVASAMQKAIRRGQEEEALYWAMEFYESGYFKYVFRRLVVIAMEDVGWSNPMAVVSALLACDYAQNSKTPVEAHILAYVVLGLVRSVKSREADEAFNFIHEFRRKGKLEIPEYCVDKHTKRGKAMGRDEKFFWENGAELDRERPSAYKERLYELLKERMGPLKMPPIHEVKVGDEALDDADKKFADATLDEQESEYNREIGKGIEREQGRHNDE